MSSTSNREVAADFLKTPKLIRQDHALTPSSHHFLKFVQLGSPSYACFFVVLLRHLSLWRGPSCRHIADPELSESPPSLEFSHDLARRAAELCHRWSSLVRVRTQLLLMCLRRGVLHLARSSPDFNVRREFHPHAVSARQGSAAYALFEDKVLQYAYEITGNQAVRPPKVHRYTISSECS